MTQHAEPKASTDTSSSLADQVIVVTGGSRGIGRSIVETLAHQGAKVVFTYAKQRDAAEAIVQDLKAHGREALAVQSDVRELSHAREIIAKAIERFGRLDGLVNNAGIVRDKALMMMESSDWEDVLATNLTGVFNYCKAAIVPLMKQRSGRIVNITSVAGLVGMPKQINYSASKAGIIGLTKALAKEVAPYGITVNAVAPGYIQSDMTAAIPEKRKAELEKLIPLGRYGRPEEIAGIVGVLLGEWGAYVTGQVIVVDGGLAI